MAMHCSTYNAGSGCECSCQTRPPLAFELRQQCDPQPSAAAHRQLSTSPPGNMGLGHVVRGTYRTAGPRTANINTVKACTYDRLGALGIATLHSQICRV